MYRHKDAMGRVIEMNEGDFVVCLNARDPDRELVKGKIYKIRSFNVLGHICVEPYGLHHSHKKFIKVLGLPELLQSLGGL